MDRAQRQPRGRGQPISRAAAPVAPPVAATPPAAELLDLQRAIGNLAFQRLVQRQATPAAGALPPLRRAAMVTLRRAPVSRAPITIQRYVEGEHIQFGQVENLIGPEKKSHTVTPPPKTYTVAADDTPDAIAARFGVPLDFLIARNASQYKTQPAARGKKVVGFPPGAGIILPGKTLAELAGEAGVSEQVLRDHNPATVKTWTVPGSGATIEGADRGSTLVVVTGKLGVSATPAPSGTPPAPMKTVKIKGVTFDYGQVMALGDHFQDPKQLFSASAQELRAMKALLDREAAKPGSVKNSEWNQATGGRFATLAQANVAHFAPSNPALTPATATSSVNHKSEWERYHRQALEAAQGGDKEKALGINAFADHFLTDAFSSGHLFNKEDVMNRFDKAFDAKARELFFREVAKLAWADPKVSGLLPKYETVDFRGVVFRPNIDRLSRFQTLLEGIYADPDGKAVVYSAVAKIIHDYLNDNGVLVENDRGESWILKGDGSLNEVSLRVGRQAVAQSQVNVLNAVGVRGTLDFAGLFKRVWEYTPHPTADSTKKIHDLIAELTNPREAAVHRKAAAVISGQIDTIVGELVRRRKLKKA
jgi:hypothetical protein